MIKKALPLILLFALSLTSTYLFAPAPLETAEEFTETQEVVGQILPFIRETRMANLPSSLDITESRASKRGDRYDTPKDSKKVARNGSDESRVIYSEITAYCDCTICCGDNADGITATGTIPQEGRTVATDWNYLPRGTRLKIEGFGDTVFVVEDTFGRVDKGYRIDIYYSNHADAVVYGRRRDQKVIILEGGQ